MSPASLRFESPQIQRLRRLIGRRSARTEANAFAVEGPTLINEAVRAGWIVESIYIPEGIDIERLGVVGIEATLVHHLGTGVLERLATTENPQPAIAIVAQRREGADRLVAATRVLVTDQVADPGNLGTIIRSAEAAGFDALVLTPDTVDPFNTKVVRASAGALFHVPLVTSDLAHVRASGLTIVGSSSHRGVAHTQFDWPQRLALVAGNETHGITAEADIDEWVCIEHAGRAESLNVAMATTLLCFESTRDHRRPGSG